MHYIPSLAYVIWKVYVRNKQINDVLTKNVLNKHLNKHLNTKGQVN